MDGPSDITQLDRGTVIMAHVPVVQGRSMTVYFL